MSFDDFQFNDHIAGAIRRCGFTTPTPIQQQALGPVLARRDMLGLAQTGTGKTAAFALPTVQHLMATGATGRPRALIIAPTRELAEQINEFVRTVIAGTPLRSLSVYGGVGKPGQVERIRRGVDLIVACPGRLLDLLNDRAVDLGGIETLILDEADHMFDKGFLPDIRRILRQVPKKRQTLVFSATMPAEIRHLAEEILTDPVTVQINPTRSVDAISHQVISVEQSRKTDLLVHLLASEPMTSTLVFARTKHKAKGLAQKLVQAGFRATSLQGNLSQNRRQQALDGFKDGTFAVLVATDIAARGIDVAGISHVINYDMPDTAEAYIHRTGRTGRASRTGEAVNFATAEDRRMLITIERSLSRRMDRREIALPAAARQEPATRQEPAARQTPAAPRGGQRRQGQAAAKPASATRREGRPARAGVFGLGGRGNR